MPNLTALSGLLEHARNEVETLKERLARWEAEGGPGAEDIERLAAALIKERDAHRATKARLARVQAALEPEPDKEETNG